MNTNTFYPVDPCTLMFHHKNVHANICKIQKLNDKEKFLQQYCCYISQEEDYSRLLHEF